MKALLDASMHGKVSDNVGQPIPGVAVELRIVDSTTVVTSSVAGADGGYALSAPVGNYDVVATPPAGSIYLPQTFRNEAIGPDTVFNIVLVRIDEGPGPGPDPVMVTVNGRVLDASGNPLVQATVSLSPVGAGLGGSVPTDADGRYTLHVAPGSFTIGVSGPYDTTDGSSWSNTHYSLTLKQTLTIAADTAVPDVSMPPLFKLSFYVVDASSLAVEGASVSGSSTAADLGSYTVSSYFTGGLTDGSGNCELNVYGGVYTVQARLGDLPSGSSTVTVQADAQVDVVLPATAAVSGRVVDDSGAPLRQIQVCLDQTTPGAPPPVSCLAPTRTDDDGRYLFQVLLGTYSLGIKGSYSPSTSSAPPPPDAGPGPIHVGYGTYQLSLNDTVTVGADVTMADLVLPARHQLSVHVVDAYAAPVANATVSGSSTPGDLGTTTIQSTFGGVPTDANGNCEIEVYDGAFTVQAMKQGLPSVPTAVTVHGDTPVEIVMAMPSTVSGRVLDAAGNPMAYVYVCLAKLTVWGAPSCTAGLATLTGADGRYAIDALPGSYALFASGPYTMPFSLALKGTLTVTGDLVVPDVVLPPRYQLTGRVIDPDNVPVAGASVSGGSGKSDFGSYTFSASFGSTTTDSSGHFAATVFLGSWSVSVSPPEALGLRSFSVDAGQIDGDLTLAISVQFLADSAANPAVPAGGSVTTDQNGVGATPTDPVETTVTTPAAGAIRIDEVAISEMPPQGYFFLTQQVDITAPQASAGAPLVLQFEIDCSRLPAGCDPNSVEVFRNAVLVPGCADNTGVASPDPCVAQRARVGTNVDLTVLTSTASHWNFGLATAPVSQPPVVTVPSGLTIEATSAQGAVVTFSTSATDSSGQSLTPVCAPASGSVFPLGATQVVCQAVDQAGNLGEASFIVSVVDTSAPVFSNVPGTVTVYATSTKGATVSYELPTATDAVDGASTVNCVPAPGTEFAVNRTTVTCASSDTRGNRAQTSFTVWVTYSAPADETFFLPPVRANAVFPNGRAIPVKFQLTGASSGIADLRALFVVTKVSDAIGAGLADPGTDGSGDTDLIFKYEPPQTYSYVWKTSKTAQGTYRVQADLGDGVTHQVLVSLKR